MQQVPGLPIEGRVRFLDAELDVDAHTLHVCGQQQHLEPKAFDLLLCLLRERHRAVGKDELLDAVWPGRIVVESALKRTVGQIRQALGDDPREPRYIRTVHGVGYQFVAAWETVAREPAPAPMGAPTAAVESRSKPGDGRWRWSLGMAAGLLLGVLLAVLLLSPPGANDSRQRLALLPVENATGSAENDWLDMGLPALIGQALADSARVELLPMPAGQRLARDLALGFHSEPARLQEARSLLGARGLAQGRLEGGPGNWRLTLRVAGEHGRVDVRELQAPELGELAWRSGYEGLREFAGPLPTSLMRQGADPYIDETYARALSARARGDSGEARDLLAVVARSRPADMEARIELVETEFQLGLRESAAVAASELADLLEPAAEQQDPTAQRLLQRLRLHQGVAASARADRDEAERQLAEALVLAETRGDALGRAEALRLLGTEASAAQQWNEAELHLSRSLALFEAEAHLPGVALVHNNLGVLFWRRDLPAESARWHRLALEGFNRLGRVDAQASTLGNLGTLAFRAGEIEDALGLYREALAIHLAQGNVSQQLLVRGNLARVEAFLGRLSEARSEAEAMRRGADRVEDAANAAFARLQLGLIAARSGDVAEATTWLADAARRFEATGQLDYRLSAIAHQLRVLAEAGEIGAAEALLATESELFRAEVGPHARAQRAWALAELAVAHGDADSALAQLEQGRDWILQAGSPVDINTFDALRSLVLLRAGRIEEAASWVARLDDIHERFLPALLARARLAYEQRELQRALALKLAAKASAGEGWLPGHAAQLARFQSAVEAGQRLALGDEL